MEIERAFAPFHDGLFPLYTEGGLRSACLVPIGIGSRLATGFVETPHLLWDKTPANGAKVLPELLLIASADYDRRNSWAFQ